MTLSSTGTHQARALGRWLGRRPAAERPTAVVTSPYVRAARTAELVLDGAGLDDLPVVCDERLRERDLGAFDGLTGHGIREHHPEEARRRQRLGKFYCRPPGGKSWSDVALRVRSVVGALHEKYAGERVLVVSHQAVIMVFRYVLETMSEQEILAVDAAEQIANCSLTRYTAGDGGLVLSAYNDVTPIAERGEPVTQEPDADDAAAEQDGDAETTGRPPPMPAARRCSWVPA